MFVIVAPAGFLAPLKEPCVITRRAEVLLCVDVLSCTAHKGFQRFEALEQSEWVGPSQAGAGLAPRQRFLFISILDKKVRRPLL